MNLEEELQEVKRRMDDFNVRNDEFYEKMRYHLLDMMTDITVMKADIERLKNEFRKPSLFIRIIQAIKRAWG